MSDINLTYLHKKNLLNSVRACVGIDLFKNVFVRRSDGVEFDALDDGENSCAYFVSGILTLHELIDKPHAVVPTTITKLLESGWQESSEPSPGSVVYWPEKDGHAHIGFYLDENTIISNHSLKKQPAIHGLGHPIDGRQPTKYFSNEKLLAD